MLRGCHPNPPQGHSLRRGPVHRGPGLLLGEPDPGPRRSPALDASSGPLGGPSIRHRTPDPSRGTLAGAAPLSSNAQGDHSRDDRRSLLGDDGPALVASPAPWRNLRPANRGPAFPPDLGTRTQPEDRGIPDDPAGASLVHGLPAPK